MQQPFYKRPLIWVLLIVFVIIIFTIILLNSFSFQSLTEDLSSFFSRKPKPGSCLILEEKYCKLAKLIQKPNDPDGLIAVFNVPKDTTLFSPIDGFYSRAGFPYKDSLSGKYFTYPSAIILVGKQSAAKYVNSIYGFIYYNHGQQFSLSVIRKGNIIGTISDTPIKYFGNYNLAFTITKKSFKDGKIEFLDDTNKLKTILGLK